MSTMLTKKNRFEIEKLEDRIAPAVAIGGLAAVAIDEINVDIPIDVNVENNEICVAVAAVASVAACD